MKESAFCKIGLDSGLRIGYLVRHARTTEYGDMLGKLRGHQASGLVSFQVVPHPTRAQQLGQTAYCQTVDYLRRMVCGNTGTPSEPTRHGRSPNRAYHTLER